MDRAQQGDDVGGEVKGRCSGKKTWSCDSCQQDLDGGGIMAAPRSYDKTSA